VNYPAGNIEVRGEQIPVQVTDRGYWTATNGDGTTHSSSTKDELYKLMMRATVRKTVKVEVPFVTLEGSKWAKPGDPRHVRLGTATGIHQGTRDILVTWHDDRRETKGTTGRHVTATLQPLSAEEGAEWVRLDLEARRARTALGAFEEAHKLYLAVAVAEAVEAKTREEADK
jgi:hypothetical protein